MNEVSMLPRNLAVLPSCAASEGEASSACWSFLLLSSLVSQPLQMSVVSCEVHVSSSPTLGGTLGYTLEVGMILPSTLTDLLPSFEVCLVSLLISAKFNSEGIIMSSTKSSRLLNVCCVLGSVLNASC